MTIFGPICGPDVVQDVVLAHLKKWLPTYLAEVAEQRGKLRGALAKPGSWQVLPEFDNSLEGKLPAVMVVSSDEVEPQREGNGRVRATYPMGVAILVDANGQLAAKRLAGRYGAAVAALVQQKPSLGDPRVAGTTYLGMSTSDVPVLMSRSLASVTVSFDVEWSQAYDYRGGPVEPAYTDPLPEDNPSPYPEWGVVPDADHVIITVDDKE